MIKKLLKVLLLPLLLVLGSCAYSGVESISKLSSLGQDQIMIVGKIRLVPKFDPAEQSLNAIMIGGRSRITNKVFLAIGNEYISVESYRSIKNLTQLGSVAINKTFMVSAKRTKPLIFSGAFFVSSFSGNFENYYLPSGLMFNYRNNDRAIYVGTIEFHRNNFDEITKVRIIDEYIKANREFIKLFGKDIKLKKIKPVILKKQKGS